MARAPGPSADVGASATARQGSPVVTSAAGVEPARLCPIAAKIGHRLSLEIDAYADSHGITRSRAAAIYLDIASETLREREGIPGGRADELLDVLEALRSAMDILGPPALGVVRLLAHWATQTGGLKVDEDELLAEVRTVGSEEWEQAVAEAERTCREMSQLVEKATQAGD